MAKVFGGNLCRPCSSRWLQKKAGASASRNSFLTIKGKGSPNRIWFDKKVKWLVWTTNSKPVSMAQDRQHFPSLNKGLPLQKRSVFKELVNNRRKSCSACPLTEDTESVGRLKAFYRDSRRISSLYALVLQTDWRTRPSQISTHKQLTVI